MSAVLTRSVASNILGFNPIFLMTSHQTHKTLQDVGGFILCSPHPQTLGEVLAQAMDGHPLSEKLLIL